MTAVPQVQQERVVGAAHQHAVDDRRVVELGAVAAEGVLRRERVARPAAAWGLALDASQRWPAAIVAEDFVVGLRRKRRRGGGRRQLRHFRLPVLRVERPSSF